MTEATAGNGDCQNTRAQISPYLTDRLAVDERARYQAHLAACPDCASYVELTDEAIHITCQDIVELVTDYLENVMPADRRARFEAHLALCKGCRAYLEQMRETIALTGKLTAESIPPAAKRELLAAFRNWQRG